MNDVMSFIVSLFGNCVTWLFSSYIVTGVSVGGFIVVAFIIGIIISNLVLVARR